LGQIIYVNDEGDIDKYTAIIGSGSGFVFHILSVYEKAAKELGLGEDVDSRELVMKLFDGSLEMAKKRICGGNEKIFGCFFFLGFCIFKICFFDFVDFMFLFCFYEFFKFIFNDNTLCILILFIFFDKYFFCFIKF
jgi:hypothetical protein